MHLLFWIWIIPKISKDIKEQNHGKNGSGPDEQCYGYQNGINCQSKFRAVIEFIGKQNDRINAFFE